MHLLFELLPGGILSSVTVLMVLSVAFSVIQYLKINSGEKEDGQLKVIVHIPW